jgi:hypothetical protein
VQDLLEFGRDFAVQQHHDCDAKRLTRLAAKHSKAINLMFVYEHCTKIVFQIVV